MSVCIAVGAIVGDHAPLAIVCGALLTLADDEDLDLIPAGQTALCRRAHDAVNGNGCAFRTSRA